MDKQTISHYGWIIVVILVLTIMISLSTPFGEYVSNNFKNIAQGLTNTFSDKLGLEPINFSEKETELTLIPGPEFNRIIPNEVSSIEFLNSAAPSNIDGVDVSEGQDGSIIAWVDGTVYKIAPKEPGGKIYANPDSSSMFRCGDAWDSIIIDRHLTSVSFENFNTSKVTNMCAMFFAFGIQSENITIDGIQQWDTSNVTDMSEMFFYFGAYNSSNDFNYDLSNWNTSKVTNMGWMFDCAASDGGTFYVGDLSNWDVSNVTNMSGLFGAAGSDATHWYIGQVTNWDVSNVNRMDYMFSNACGKSSVWNIGDLSQWGEKTANVTNMRCMFSSAGSYVDNFELDLSTWDTSNVVDMEGMFSEVAQYSKEFHLDLSNFNTSKVENMRQMFYYAAQHVEDFNLDLSSFDTSSVTDMTWMFKNAGENAESFKLDLSGWGNKLTKVIRMNYMFQNAGLNADYLLDLSDWITPSIRYKTDFDKGVESKVITPWE